MTRRFTQTVQAEQDIDAIAEYLAQRESIDLAIRFYDAAWTSFDRIADAPGKGRTRESPDPELAGLRSWPVDGFPSLRAFYVPTPDGIRVLRVLHGARDIDTELEQRPGL